MLAAMKLNRMVIVAFFIFSSVNAFAVEVICNSLTKASYSIRYSRIQASTPTGPVTLHSGNPTQTLEAVPSKSHAGSRGELLQPGECSLRTATLAPSIRQIVIHFRAGQNFVQSVDARGIARGAWENMGGACCKPFKFEADFSQNGSLLVLQVNLQNTSVEYLDRP